MRITLPDGLSPGLAAGLAALALFLAFALGAIRSALPGDSADRLAWWIGFWNYLAWRRSTRQRRPIRHDERRRGRGQR